MCPCLGLVPFVLPGKSRSGQFPPVNFPRSKGLGLRLRLVLGNSPEGGNWPGGNFPNTLIKNSLTNSLLVTVIAQSTANTTNSEKTVHFLSLTSSSRNKLKSHMFFTCKKSIFSDFTWKKNFSPGNCKAGGGASLFPTALLCLYFRRY